MTRQRHCGSSPLLRNTARLWYSGRANTDIYMHKGATINLYAIRSYTNMVLSHTHSTSRSATATPVSKKVSEFIPDKH